MFSYLLNLGSSPRKSCAQLGDRHQRILLGHQRHVFGPEDLLVNLDDLIFTDRQGLSFDGNSVQKEGAVLADAPAGHLSERLLLGAVFGVADRLPGLVHDVRLEVRRLRDQLLRNIKKETGSWLVTLLNAIFTVNHNQHSYPPVSNGRCSLS